MFLADVRDVVKLLRGTLPAPMQADEDNALAWERDEAMHARMVEQARNPVSTFGEDADNISVASMPSPTQSAAAVQFRTRSASSASRQDDASFGRHALPSASEDVRLEEVVGVRRGLESAPPPLYFNLPARKSSSVRINIPDQLLPAFFPFPTPFAGQHAAGLPPRELSAPPLAKHRASKQQVSLQSDGQASPHREQGISCKVGTGKTGDACWGDDLGSRKERIMTPNAAKRNQHLNSCPWSTLASGLSASAVAGAERRGELPRPDAIAGRARC